MRWKKLAGMLATMRAERLQRLSIKWRERARRWFSAQSEPNAELIPDEDVGRKR